jgi:hypothetical protein
VIGLTDAQTGGQPGLNASFRVSQNKTKPKMVKPKNSEIVFGKQSNPKVVISIKEKSRSPVKNFRLSLKDKIM